MGNADLGDPNETLTVIPLYRYTARRETAMDLELEGKTAIVTGASRGIGKAVARELALSGCDVVICARTPEDLELAARELSQETGRR